MTTLAPIVLGFTRKKPDQKRAGWTVGAGATTERWMQAIDGPAQAFPHGWGGWETVREAHIRLLEREMAREHIPQKEGGRGIVCGAGGAKYFACAFAMMKTCRAHGSTLPMEFWHLGPHEMDPAMQRAAEHHGVRVVDAVKECAKRGVTPRILNGWELKPLAVLLSQFSEVLYLDADCLPARNPDLLFDHPEYVKHGAAFWPDLPPYDRNEWVPEVCWNNIGMEYQHSRDFETGQFMVDKSKCMREISVANWMNQHSDWFYQFVFGDKSTFHLAWKKCGTKYAMPDSSCGWIHPCIVQNHWDGAAMFYHACQGKEDIVAGEMSHLPVGQMVKDAKEELATHWSGTIYNWSEMGDEEMRFAKEHIGTYQYWRENAGSRGLQLLDNGEIGQGKADCERRWAVTMIDGTPSIVVIGAAHKGSEIAMFLARKAGDGFFGQWTAFERSRCSLTPLPQHVGAA